MDGVPRVKPKYSPVARVFNTKHGMNNMNIFFFYNDNILLLVADTDKMLPPAVGNV